MENWRIAIKDWFKENILAIPEIKKFDYWNNQNADYEITDDIATPAVFLEYSMIGVTETYFKQTNLQSAAKKPVSVSLHILIKSQKNLEEATDELFEVVKLVHDKFVNKHSANNTGLTTMKLTTEIMNTSHDSVLEYVLTFSCVVVEVVEVVEDEKCQNIREDMNNGTIKVKPEGYIIKP